MVYDTLMATRFAERHPQAAARALLTAGATDANVFLLQLDSGARTRLLDAMAAADIASLLESMDNQQRANILDQLGPDSAEGVLRRLSAEQQQETLAIMPDAKRRRLERALQFDASTLGSAADPGAPTCSEDQTGEVALKRTRRRGDQIPYVYVTDRTNRLIGVVSRRELISAPSEQTVGTIMHHPVEQLHVGGTLSRAADHPGWRRWDWLPVADSEGILFGVLAHRTLRRAARRNPRSHVGGVGGGMHGLLELGTAYCDVLARGLVSVTVANPAPGRGGQP